MKRDKGSIIRDIHYHQNQIDELRSQLPIDVSPIQGVAWLAAADNRPLGRQIYIRAEPDRQICQQVASPIDAIEIKDAIEQHKFINLIIEFEGRSK